MIPENSDPSRYYFEDVEESIRDKYTRRQLEQVLSEFGYDEFPDNGIDSIAFDGLMDRLAGLDKSESRLERIEERRDLSYETKKGLEKKSLPKMIFKWVGNIPRGIIEHSLVLPTALRKDLTKFPKKFEDMVYTLTFLHPPFPLVIPYIHFLAYPALFSYNPELGKNVLYSQIATNVMSLGYEIFRGIRRRTKSRH